MKLAYLRNWFQSFDLCDIDYANYSVIDANYFQLINGVVEWFRS